MTEDERTAVEYTGALILDPPGSKLLDLPVTAVWFQGRFEGIEFLTTGTKDGREYFNFVPASAVLRLWMTPR